MNSRDKTGKSAADRALEERVSFGGSIHANFQHQLRTLLEQTKLSEEDRQKILTNMSCPCCGGSGAELAIKIDGS